MLTVAKYPDGEDGLISIPISTICFLQYANYFDRVVVHTENCEYYLPGTLKYWTTVLNSSGFCFYYVDRGASINVNNVSSIDRTFTYVYFNGQNQKRCSVAVYRIDETTRNLHALNPNIHITPTI